MTMEKRPTLTQEEIAVLNTHAQTYATAASVLKDLEEIGVDVTEHRALLEHGVTLSNGLLDRFTATQFVPPKPRTRGK